MPDEGLTYELVRKEYAPDHEPCQVSEVTKGQVGCTMGKEWELTFNVNDEHTITLPFCTYHAYEAEKEANVTWVREPDDEP